RTLSGKPPCQLRVLSAFSHPPSRFHPLGPVCLYCTAPTRLYKIQKPIPALGRKSVSQQNVHGFFKPVCTYACAPGGAFAFHRPCLLPAGVSGRLFLPAFIPAFVTVSTSAKACGPGNLYCCPFGFSALLVSVSWRSKPQAREVPSLRQREYRVGK